MVGKSPETTQPAPMAAPPRTQVPGRGRFIWRRVWPPVRRGQGFWVGSGVGSRASLGRPYWNTTGSCQGEGVGRQKFRLRTSWELSKGKKKKTSRCQEAREMFVDFLLHIHHFQLGFEANFLIEGLPGAVGSSRPCCCGSLGNCTPTRAPG